MAHFLDGLTPAGRRRQSKADGFSAEDVRAIVDARERGATWRAIYEAFESRGLMPYASLNSFQAGFPGTKVFLEAKYAESSSRASAPQNPERSDGTSSSTTDKEEQP